MNQAPITPEEFARLLSLEENHPDRRRAEAAPEFRARLALLREFEAPTSPAMGPDEIAAAERALDARLASAIPSLSPGAARASDSGGAPQSASAPQASGARSAATAPARERGGWLATLLRGPAPRLAFAALAVVAVVAVWPLRHESSERPVRGVGAPVVLELLAPRESAGALDLTWTPVPGADRYRVVFYGADLRELARVDDVAGARLSLRADSLPAGLAARTDVLAEVTAMRAGDPIAVSKSRALRLP